MVINMVNKNKKSEIRTLEQFFSCTSEEAKTIIVGIIRIMREKCKRDFFAQYSIKNSKVFLTIPSGFAIWAQSLLDSKFVGTNVRREESYLLS